jgi:hypothetical protein
MALGGDLPDFVVDNLVQGVEPGQVVPGFLAEFGVAMDVQHADIDVRHLHGPLDIPRFGKILVGNDQLPPEFPVGLGGNIGEKTPVKPLYQIKNPQNYILRYLALDNGLDKLFKLGKSDDLPGHDFLIEKEK